MHSFYELSRVMKPGKFCLTTVDTVFKEKDFASYVRAFDEDTDNDGMMAVTPFIDDEKPLFVETDEQNSIKAFLDEHADGVKYVSGGVYALNEKAVRVLEECMANGMSRMRNFQRGLIAAGLKLKAYPIEKIVDVDHANDIETAERFISE